MDSALLGACSFDGTVYAVGGGFTQAALYVWSSRRWVQRATMLSAQRLWSCWAGPKQVLYAVGQKGAIFRRNAEGWHQDLLPESIREADLYGVWGLADGTAVAVGGDLASPNGGSVIVYFDGHTWSRVHSSNIQTRTLRSVWGSTTSDLWAVGDDGAIAHYDGVDWRQSATHVDDRLYEVFGVDSDEVYAVGGTGRGLILRWNGSSWIVFDEVSKSLRSIWTTAQKPLVVGGDDGYLARYIRGNGSPGHNLPEVGRQTETAPFPLLRVNSLVGLGTAMLGAASTMNLDEVSGDWLGAIVSQGRSFDGPIVRSAYPDAGSWDAGAVLDAGPGASR